MKKLLILLLLFVAAGCAPSREFTLKNNFRELNRFGLAAQEKYQKLPYALFVVKPVLDELPEFDYPSIMGGKFEHKGDMAETIQKTVADAVSQRGMFAKVLTEGNPGPSDLVLKLNVNKLAWEDTSSQFMNILYTVATVDLYVLFGGSVVSPKAEVEIGATLELHTGDVLFNTNASYSDEASLSRYEYYKASPEIQLTNALSSTAIMLSSEIYSNFETIRDKLPKLDIVITSSRFPQHSTTPDYSLRGHVRGILKEASVSITLNNKTILSENSKGNIYEISQRLLLKPGENTIIVKAMDLANNSDTETCKVTYTPNLPANRRYAYLGISGCEKFKKKLYGAELVKEFLSGSTKEQTLEPGMIKSRETNLFLKDAIGKTHDGGDCIIFYSGHAEPTSIVKDLILCTKDSKKGDEVTGILVSKLPRYLPESAKSLILIAVVENKPDKGVRDVIEYLTDRYPRLSVLYIYTQDHKALLKDIDKDNNGTISCQEWIDKAGKDNCVASGSLSMKTELFKVPEL